jgi:multiple sugar transport system permease protein
MKQKSNLLINKRIEPYIFIGPAILILLVVTIYPLIYSFNISLRSVSLLDLSSRPIIGLNNYLEAFKDLTFWTAIKNTTIFSLVLVVEFVFGFGLALLINYTLRIGRVVKVFLMAPMMVAPVVVSLMWRFMYNTNYGIINYFLTSIGMPRISFLNSPGTAMLSVMIVDIWQWTPFFFVILYAGLQSLPKDPYEAAAIDGASPFQSFIYITLPLFRSLITIAVLIRLMEILKTFDLFYILTQGGPGLSTEVLSYYIYRVSFKWFELGYGAALSFILIIIVTLISLGIIRLIEQPTPKKGSG